MPGRRAYLGIGSNLGDRLGYLQLAVDELGPHVQVEQGPQCRRFVAGVRHDALPICTLCGPA